MPAMRLLTKLLVFYAVLAAMIVGIFTMFPGAQDYLPVGRVQSLMNQAESATSLNPAELAAAMPKAKAMTIGGSIVWLVVAVAGALLCALPVSWVYMEIRNPSDYDQSLIDTIVVLPLVVASIVVVVQNSLALAFSLAGIAGAARYRNSLKSSGDLLFILLAIGIGISVGIGAMELALVTSAAFNLVFVALWSSEYGERAEMKRFLSDFEHPNGHNEPGTVTATVTTAVVTEVSETFASSAATPVPAPATAPAPPGPSAS